jgi:hypothetical protein
LNLGKYFIHHKSSYNASPFFAPIRSAFNISATLFAILFICEFNPALCEELFFGAAGFDAAGVVGGGFGGEEDAEEGGAVGGEELTEFGWG